MVGLADAMGLFFGFYLSIDFISLLVASFLHRKKIRSLLTQTVETTLCSFIPGFLCSSFFSAFFGVVYVRGNAMFFGVLVFRWMVLALKSFEKMCSITPNMMELFRALFAIFCKF